MPRYTVIQILTFNRTLGTYTADTPEEAQHKALAYNGDLLLCPRCSRGVEDVAVVETRVEEAE